MIATRKGVAIKWEGRTQRSTVTVDFVLETENRDPVEMETGSGPMEENYGTQDINAGHWYGVRGRRDHQGRITWFCRVPSFPFIFILGLPACWSKAAPPKFSCRPGNCCLDEAGLQFTKIHVPSESWDKRLEQIIPSPHPISLRIVYCFFMYTCVPA